MFSRYPSNVFLSTACNYILLSPEPRRMTARCYLRCQSFGALNWRFWFSNAVDSTFADGADAWRGRDGGPMTIHSARIGDGGAWNRSEMTEPAPVTGWTEVLFDGAASREVQPAEGFWSDEVSFTLPEGHLLVWEWDIEGDAIPCTPDSQAATFVSGEDGELKYTFACPAPALFGAARPVKETIAFFGDSITQGCGTGCNVYEMWAAKIAEGLGREYACWNLGVGYARAADAAFGGAWLKKALTADTVCIAHGVNDLLSGAYGRGRSDTAEEILASVRAMLEAFRSAGKRMILFTVPPFDYNPQQYENWKALRLAYPQLAEEFGAELFDFSAALDGNPPFGNECIYGSHPDGRGGTAAANAFLACRFFEK